METYYSKDIRRQSSITRFYPRDSITFREFLFCTFFFPFSSFQKNDTECIVEIERLGSRYRIKREYHSWEWIRSLKLINIHYSKDIEGQSSITRFYPRDSITFREFLFARFLFSFSIKFLLPRK